MKTNKNSQTITQAGTLLQPDEHAVKANNQPRKLNTVREFYLAVKAGTTRYLMQSGGNEPYLEDVSICFEHGKFNVFIWDGCWEETLYWYDFLTKNLAGQALLEGRLFVKGVAAHV